MLILLLSNLLFFIQTPRIAVNKQPQKTKFAKQLVAIKPDVSSDDIKAAVKLDIASQPTISRYLSGRVKNPKLAHDLLKFFKSQIDQRARILQ